MIKATPHLLIACLLLLLAAGSRSYSQALPEQPLWPHGIADNPVHYPEEKLRTSEVRKSSLSQLNRVYSFVSTPTYILHKPEKSNGVALVICPGGGFRDVWLDREGNDLALFLMKYGITSMVLKYRTYNAGSEGMTLKYDDYIYHVYADAKQAIYLLRNPKEGLGLNATRIGIGGFSAGGALALGTALEIGDDKLPLYANHTKDNTRPDFAFLVYPGIHPDFLKAAELKPNLPPMFIINGAEDTVTPAKSCVDLFSILQKRAIKAEIHIYAKGGHGFDSGVERGNGISIWRDSFIAWLKDLEN